ncbi:MAG TPA: hypothetical protein VFC03_18995 [Acidimicrobiales bacterium]|nr:hypothetical protein [Acidimicrobiales bacterium]
MTVQHVVLPHWFRSIAPNLNGHQVVLTFPAWFTSYDTAMTRQAVDRMQFSMVGEAPPAGLLERVGKERGGAAVIANVSLPPGTTRIARAYASAGHDSAITAEDAHALQYALKEWGVTTVVIPDDPALPAYDQIPSVTNMADLITAATGTLPIHQADAWVWTGVANSGTHPVPNAEQLAGCSAGLAPRGYLAVSQSTECIIAALPPSPPAETSVT